MAETGTGHHGQVGTPRGTRSSRLFAGLWSATIVLSACGGSFLPVSEQPAADECVPSDKPFVAPHAGAANARDIVLTTDRLPLCAYRVDTDEPIGKTGWHRIFRPLNEARASFVFLSVSVYQLGTSESTSTFVARHSTNSFHWDGTAPVMTEIPAEVVGDGAKAFRADAGPDIHPQYFYVTGYGGYGFEIIAEPSRTDVDAAAVLVRLVTVARDQIAFAGMVAVAMQVAPPPSGAPTGAPTALPSVAPLPSGRAACHSDYDGTYTGQAEYAYEYYDQATAKTVNGGPHALNLTLVLQCQSISVETDRVVLSVTRAAASDPYFGVLGLVDLVAPAGGTASLPKETPFFRASATGGYGITVTFPNGAMLLLMAVTVRSFNGDSLASDLSANGVPPGPWQAAKVGTDAMGFPAVPAGDMPRTTYRSWSLLKSAN